MKTKQIFYLWNKENLWKWRKHGLFSRLFHRCKLWRWNVHVQVSISFLYEQRDRGSGLFLYLVYVPWKTLQCEPSPRGYDHAYSTENVILFESVVVALTWPQVSQCLNHLILMTDFNEWLLSALLPSSRAVRNPSKKKKRFVLVTAIDFATSPLIKTNRNKLDEIIHHESYGVDI